MNKLKQWPITLPVYTKKTLQILILGVVVLGIRVDLFAADQRNIDLIANQHYIELKSTPASEDDTITLYCWLGSESCYTFETVLTDWATEHALKLHYQPLIKRPHWRRLAKARLVAQIMQAEAEVTDRINRHLYQDNNDVSSDEVLFELLEGSTISTARFSNLYYAAETNQRINQIQVQAQENRVKGVPTVVINNRWLVDASMHPTSRDMINAIAQLLNLPRL